MPLFGSMLWDALTATGGALALSLIVTIALGISAMTLLFVGSAVVVLERFARAVRRTRSLVGCGALWSLRFSRYTHCMSNPWPGWRSGKTF